MSKLWEWRIWQAVEGHLVCVIMTHCVQKFICDLVRIDRGCWPQESPVQNPDWWVFKILRWSYLLIWNRQLSIIVAKMFPHIGSNVRVCNFYSTAFHLSSITMQSWFLGFIECFQKSFFWHSLIINLFFILCLEFLFWKCAGYILGCSFIKSTLTGS